MADKSVMKKTGDARLIAAQTVTSVVRDQQSLTQLLPRALERGHDDQAALIHELTAGTLRWWWRLKAQLDGLIDKPFKPKDTDLYCLMAVGLYQLQYTRIPDHAVVSQTVNSVKALKKVWATKLVNAILRRAIRENESISEKLTDSDTYQFAHPNWMIEKVQQDWPVHWQTVLEANNAQSMLTLRVNTQKMSRDQVLETLLDQDIKAVKTTDSRVGIRLTENHKIWQTPLWQQGVISVHDESAQLASVMTSFKPGMRVLDACAAPGGKTCHLLEVEPAIELIAIDKDENRLEKLNENVNRLQQTCLTKVADAANLDDWWDGILFDIVLLDAPCSGSGVIRKHPDIKLLRQETDIEQYVKTQRQLLATLWQVLKNQATMLYCTCSVFHQENDAQAQWFLSNHSNAEILPLDDRFGLNLKFGRQRLPGLYESDGFYYAAFKKNA